MLKCEVFQVPPSADNTDQIFPTDEESKELEQDISALEMLALETPDLPIPLTNAEISAIEIATIRRHQQNREKPLQTFEVNEIN